MLKYSPLLKKYPGDAHMRQDSHKNGAAGHNSTTTAGERQIGGSSQEYSWMVEYKNKSKEARTRRGTNSRLCSDLNMLDHHLKSAETSSRHGKACKVCGAITYSKCTIRGANLHLMANRGKSAGLTCFLLP